MTQGSSRSFPTPAQRPAIADCVLLSQARETLVLEARAISSLANRLGEEYVEAVNLLGRVSGRIVVTGMGKSGHIARKLAATLASTGSPAQFVHPAEASHGDLGMIMADDAILALSNSGETAELGNLITYSRRFGILLVAITGREGSSLARASDIVLKLPPVAEACPMGLAPTTSTTMMLALGDALAVSLMLRHEFSAEDFKRLHPGGRLGKVLLRVGDIMHQGEELPLVHNTAGMIEVVLTMTSRRFGAAGVIDDTGRLVGVVTDGDLRRHMSDRLLQLNVIEVMGRSPKTVGAGDLAAEALGLMNRLAITCLFVVDEQEAKKPVGILHVHDCLWAGLD